MKLGELEGRRIELIKANAWVAGCRPSRKSGYVDAGAKGTVRVTSVLPGCPMAHIVFDDIKTKSEDHYFGIGNTGQEFSENIQKWLKVIDEDDPCGERECDNCDIAGCEHGS